MKTTILSAALAAMLFGGVASAQPAGGGRSVSRADAAVRADRQFARLDADGDGSVTAAELGTRQQARKQARAARSGNIDRVARRFARIDADGNGAVTLTEMRTAQAARGDRMQGNGARGLGRRGARVIGRMDGDGNGAVSRAEFQAQALTRFARLDANRDGTVTPSERRERRGR